VSANGIHGHGKQLWLLQIPVEDVNAVGLKQLHLDTQMLTGILT
jgi:hypothetical protein